MRQETKKTAIPRSVKLAVWMRDSMVCQLCGISVPWECGNAHLIRRSQGGLGVEQNLVTLCPSCHREMDEGRNAKALKSIMECYLKDLYPGWSREKVTYRKGGKL